MQIIRCASRKSLALVAFILLLTCGLGARMLVHANNSETPITGLVDHVLSGDHLVVTTPQGLRLIRIWGIDSPERGQKHSDESRQRTHELLAGKPVRIEPMHREEDGLVVARVNLEETSIDQILIADGTAWWNRTDAPDAWRLKLSEIEAKHGELGLWSEPKPIAPWVWRSR